MPHIHRFALVLHSAEEMYRLVKDVPAYPEFLSWCSSSEVLEETEDMQLASLTASLAGFERTFTTRNRLQPCTGLSLSLVDGPFESLTGDWNFHPLGDDGCKVTLDIRLKLQGGVIGMAFGQGFAFMADQMVGDFCRRADDLYADV